MNETAEKPQSERVPFDRLADFHAFLGRAPDLVDAPRLLRFEESPEQVSPGSVGQLFQLPLWRGRVLKVDQVGHGRASGDHAQAGIVLRQSFEQDRHRIVAQFSGQRTRRILQRFQAIKHEDGATPANVFQELDHFVACGRGAIRQLLPFLASEKFEGSGDEGVGGSSGLIARALAVEDQSK